MIKFVAILKDKKKGTLNQALLEEHIEHLRKQTLAGNITLCGPFKDDDGAFQLVVAQTYEAASDIVEQDPFIKEKYYQSYQIYELIEANEENNWLSTDPQTKENNKG